MENVFESGMKNRLQECLEAVGVKPYDNELCALGVSKAKLQSMWRNKNGDVPGIIVERVCQRWPEISTDYLCCGIGSPLREKETIKDSDVEKKRIALSLELADVLKKIIALNE